MLKLEYEYDERVISRGKNYLHNVNYCLKINNFLYAEVEGSFTYKTKVDLKTLDGDCSCPYATNCKHAVATYLIYKKKDHIAADGFIEHLQSLSKRELVKIIVDNLHNNPDIALNYNLKKSTKSESFVHDFIDSFSYSKLNKAQRLLPHFSFVQMKKMLLFLRDNEDEVFEKIYEDYYDDYDEGDVLYDFVGDIEEQMVKKIKTEKQVKEVLELSLNSEIIDAAQKFIPFQGVIKAKFDKDEYLHFLLNLNDPSLEEIHETITNENIMSILRLPKRNLKLAERIGQRIKNEQLLFLIAVYKRDFQNIVQYFSSFSELRRTSEYLINGIVQDIVDICIENKLENKKIAKSLLRTDFIRNYTTNQVDYLLEQIDDFDHIRWQLNFHGFFSRNIPLLEKLYTMDKGKTKEILQDIGKFFKKLHWTDIVAALVFVKKYYGRDLVEEIIKKNEDIFKTSSTLKSNLKKKRIHVSYTKGEFIVEVQ